MNWYQRMFANSLLAFLQSTVKNPKSVEKEFGILRAISDVINQIVPA